MSQPFGLSARGGLYTSLNQLEMLQQPGIASKLVNFEVDINGGYRRVNGFNLFGGASAARPAGDTKILGIRGYADGVVVCANTGIFLVRMALHGFLYLSLPYKITVMTILHLLGVQI